MDQLLNVQQVADRLQVHIMSIYKMIREGKIKAIRVPGVGLRVEAKELEKLLGHSKGEQSETQEKNDVKPGE